MPAGLQGADGEIGGDFDQGDDLQVIGLAVSSVEARTIRSLPV
jgi:hypothetical protein